MLAFEKAAAGYDKEFSDTYIGRYLRDVVWNYLDRIIDDGKELKILELNCGTGVDAVCLGARGHNILATDASAAMIAETKKKVKQQGLEKLIDTKQVKIEEIKTISSSGPFDMVFSNFGGLNCLDRDSMGEIAADIGELLKPGGRFIAVVMSKLCLWESFYFLGKFDLKNIFRRNTNGSLNVKLGNEIVPTWYYSPGEFYDFFREQFIKICLLPVGITLPPSYTENYFRSHLNTLEKLNQIEQRLNQVSFLGWFADHFLMDLKIRLV